MNNEKAKAESKRIAKQNDRAAHTSKNILIGALAGALVLTNVFNFINKEEPVEAALKDKQLINSFTWAAMSSDVIDAVTADGQDHTISLTVDNDTRTVDFFFPVDEEGNKADEAKINISLVHEPEVILSDNYKKLILGQ